MPERLPSPDELWQLWGTRVDPDQNPEGFARAFPGAEAEVRRTLELMLRLERPGPLPSLVPDGPEGWADEGLVFAGYRLVRLLGQGTFGRVFEAIDESTGEHLALKIVNPLIASVATGRGVIEREAAIARELDHQGIVRFLEAGQHRGYSWIATELFEGVPLSELPLGEGTSAEFGETAVEIGIQVARALEHSHAKGIVHRDLKPANVLVDAEGRVKVLDFGLAQTQGAVFGISATGRAVGTPLYMAPEQARGATTIGPEADIYSLGLIVVEVASGQRLERPADGLRALLRVARGRTVVPRRVWKRLDPRLASVLRRCLEPDPLDRCRSAAELAQALEDVRAGRRASLAALTSAARLARRTRRQPLAALRWIALLAAAGSALWLAWWMAPVPVQMDALLSGKVLFVDGIERGVVPTTVRLRPGEHRYELVYGRRGSDVTYEGTFEVPHRRAAFQLMPLNYLDTTPRIPALEPHGLPPEGSWIYLATNRQRMHLELLGRGFAADVEGIVTFPLPRGSHVLRVSAPGCRPREVAIDVADAEMRMLSLELDPIDSEWQTVLAYGPLDARVRESLVTDGLRVYCEEMRFSSELPVQVHKAYLGPERSGKRGTAEFWLDLPVAVADIEVEVSHHSVVGRGDLSSVVLELGPESGALVPVSDFTARSVSGEALDNLRSVMQGARRIHARYTVENAPSGDLYAYGCALRTEAIAQRTAAGELLWWPALTIRVR